MNNTDTPTVQRPPEQTTAPASQAQHILEQFVLTARADAVYGRPQQSGEAIVVPAAEVVSVMGFALGNGYGSEPASPDAGRSGGGAGGGGGGAGGGYTLARPVAAVIVSPGGVAVKPIVDVTKIALAGVAALSALAVTYARLFARTAERHVSGRVEHRPG